MSTFIGWRCLLCRGTASNTQPAVFPTVGEFWEHLWLKHAGEIIEEWGQWETKDEATA